MTGVYKVNEKERTVAFVNGNELYLKDVVEVDTTGSYLRITTSTRYYLINPVHVLYHRIDRTE